MDRPRNKSPRSLFGLVLLAVAWSGVLYVLVGSLAPKAVELARPGVKPPAACASVQWLDPLHRFISLWRPLSRHLPSARDGTCTTLAGCLQLSISIVNLGLNQIRITFLPTGLATFRTIG